jgi:predicted NBD/HSP70 family sugar kinase
MFLTTIQLLVRIILPAFSGVIPYRRIMKKTTITSSLMRDINRSIILEVIRRESPISRTMIAHRLGFSLPTVLRIVTELEADGLIRDHGHSEWSGGRRRPLYEFNAEGWYVIGIDLGCSPFYGALVNLVGSVIDEVEAKTEHPTGEAAFNQLVIMIKTLLASPHAKDLKIGGIGIGVPGIVSHEEGIVREAYHLRWHNFPLKSRLSERFDLPVIIDNDINLAAVGELWYGSGQNTTNMVVLSIGDVIDTGIIIDRGLYRGSTDCSGEIGHLIPGRDYLYKDYRAFGALESIASCAAVTEQTKSRLKDSKIIPNISNLSSEEIFDAAQLGEAWAQPIMTEMLDQLSIAVASLSALLNPEMIILGGSVSRSSGYIADQLRKRIHKSIPSLPRIVVSHLGRQAVVLGSITNSLFSKLDVYTVHKHF